MKKYVLILVLSATGLLFQNCGNYNDMAADIVGTLTWTYAVDGDGNDILQTYDYKTATFDADGNYSLDANQYLHTGTYEIVDDKYLRLDGSDDWEILTLTKSTLELKNTQPDGYEWHFSK